jgi:hypothetical protein
MTWHENASTGTTGTDNDNARQIKMTMSLEVKKANEKWHDNGKAKTNKK